MLRLIVNALAISATGLCAVTERAVKPSITNTVEHGVNTECKTCPYSLCTNKVAYFSDNSVTATCWTHGDVIGRGGTDGNNVWLKTTDACYITQYDLRLYNGTYETDLAYCGKASETKKITQAPGKAKYNTECQVCPWITCDHVSYIKYGTDLTNTCWTDDGEEILGDVTWVKTAQNCYVSQTGLANKPNRATLANCGPIPFLQVNQTLKGLQSEDKRSALPMAEPEAEAAPELAAKSVAQAAPEPPAQVNKLSKRYLLNFTVGEDYAVCHTCTKSSCPVKKKYKWDTHVITQCYDYVESTVDGESYWMLTTDFCWVRAVDFWESLFGHYRFPDCNLFD